MTEREICLNCKKKTCRGNCEDIRVAKRENKARKLTVKGETHTLTEWAKITGLDYKTIERRIKQGKVPSEVIKTSGKEK